MFGRVLLLSFLTAAACAAPVRPMRDVGDVLVRGEGDGLVVVMLHGYGARPEDLLGFAERTDFPAGTRIVMPRAPQRTHPPIGPEGGFMWWTFHESYHDPRRLSIPAMADARGRVAELLDRLRERLDVPSERVVLGGFSQGAMLAVDFALEDPRPLAGVLVLSGSYVDRERWRARLPSRRGLPVYQSHGTRDDVLVYAPAAELGADMRAAGLDVRFTSFDGGHEISRRVSAEAAAFVRAVAEGSDG